MSASPEASDVSVTWDGQPVPLLDGVTTSIDNPYSHLKKPPRLNVTIDTTKEWAEQEGHETYAVGRLAVTINGKTGIDSDYIVGHPDPDHPGRVRFHPWYEVKR